MASAKNQATENKSVDRIYTRLDIRRKERWQNAGITGDVHENRLDIKLTWIKFTAKP